MPNVAIEQRCPSNVMDKGNENQIRMETSLPARLEHMFDMEGMLSTSPHGPQHRAMEIYLAHREGHGGADYDVTYRERLPKLMKNDIEPQGQISVQGDMNQHSLDLSTVFDS